MRAHLLLRHFDFVVEDSPDDALKAARGGQRPGVAEVILTRRGQEAVERERVDAGFGSCKPSSV